VGVVGLVVVWVVGGGFFVFFLGGVVGGGGGFFFLCFGVWFFGFLGGVLSWVFGFFFRLGVCWGVLVGVWVNLGVVFCWVFWGVPCFCVGVGLFLFFGFFFGGLGFFWFCCVFWVFLFLGCVNVVGAVLNGKRGGGWIGLGGNGTSLVKNKEECSQSLKCWDTGKGRHTRLME